VLPLAAVAIAAGRPSSGPDGPGSTTPSACARAFEFVKEDVARNYAGFSDKVTPATAGDYRQLVDRLAAESSGASSHQACLSVLRRWAAFFHDSHLMVEPRVGPPAPQAAETAPASLVRLDGNTVVLRLRTFGYADIAAVQGVIAAAAQAVDRTDNLVLDLRDNPGGSDFAWQGLLPLVYTGPIRGVATSLYSTPDNIARLEEQQANPSLSPAVRAWLQNEITQMRAHPGEFVRQPDPTYTAERVLPYPKRVAVLVNRGCASSCEQLVLALRQSRKVTIYGEPTAGAVDYTNLVAATVPGGQFELVYPVSRSQRLPAESVDGRGIAPDVAIPATEEFPVAWVVDRLPAKRAARERLSDRGVACTRAAAGRAAGEGSCGRAPAFDGVVSPHDSPDPGVSSRALACPSPRRGAACER
jgi:hypothetical protein